MLPHIKQRQSAAENQHKAGGHKQRIESVKHGIARVFRHIRVITSALFGSHDLCLFTS
jgi:hypothetical protein